MPVASRRTSPPLFPVPHRGVCRSVCGRGGETCGPSTLEISSVTEVILPRGHPPRPDRRAVQRGRAVSAPAAPLGGTRIRRDRHDPVAGGNAALGGSPTGYLGSGGGRR